MSSRVLTCLLAATALLSVGCDDDSTGLSGDEAVVRVVNASPAVGELDVLVGGNVQANASDVVFLNASRECVRVDADNPQLTFQQTGGSVTIPATNFAFDAGGRNTVVVAGTSGTNLRVVTLSDPFTPELGPDSARVRVVNARATQTMNVQVFAWDEPLPTPQTINTSTNPATGWIAVEADEVVSIRPTWTVGGQTVESIINFVPLPGQELIFVAVDPVANNELRWVSLGSSRACPRP
jgi:hypothetical protein